MLIDRVYQTVKMLANTDGRGNVSPQDYNLALYNVINEKYEEYFVEVTRTTNRENRGLMNGGLENIPDRIREKIQHYLTYGTMAITSGTCPLPNNCRFIDLVQTTGFRKVEFCDNSEEFYHIAQFSLITPTATYPLALRTGNILQILPANLTGSLRINYLRNPLMPKWTYQVITPTGGGQIELFNPSANDFQDIDMHPSEEADIVRRLLIKFGINLKEPDLQAVANTLEQQDFNQQNII